MGDDGVQGTGHEQPVSSKSEGGAVDAGKEGLSLSAEEFDAFHDAHGPALWGYILRSTGDESMASDIFQEALLRFLRGAPRDLDADKRRAYVFRIASNLLRDTWRAKRREEPWRDEVLDEGEDPTAVVQESHSEGDDAEHANLSTDLDRALQALRPIERQLMWLAHVEGLSHRELANLLALQEGSVKVMLFRARQKLAALLRPATVGREVSR